MVYKRYVKKGDKLYGPYYQSSKKENGKVITEYVGKTNPNRSSVKRNYEKLFFGILLFSFILIGVLLVVNGNFNPTGKISSEDGNSAADEVYEDVSGQDNSVVPSEETDMTKEANENEKNDKNEEKSKDEIINPDKETEKSEEKDVTEESGIIAESDEISEETDVIEEIGNENNEEIVEEENETIDNDSGLDEDYTLNESASDSVNESVSENINETIHENNSTGEIYNETTNITKQTGENNSYVINEEINESNNQIYDFNVSEEINDSEIYDINATQEINETLEENLTLEVINFTNGSLTIDTTQYGAVVGMPVKWKKKISAENTTSISIELPKEAENVSVYIIEDLSENQELSNESNLSVNESESMQQDITDSDFVSITGQAVAELNPDKKLSILTFFRNLFNKIRGAITGKTIDVQEESDSVVVNIEENATEYEIKYETPAPVATEENLSNGKRVIISSDVHYENILAYAELPKEVSIDKIRLYYYDDVLEKKSLVSFDAYDSDGNLINGETPEQKGYENVSVDDLINSSDASVSLDNNNLVSFITWVVPHTSDQIYEIIIEISKAEHLDSSRIFVEDIYNEVKAQDGIWGPVINNSEYVRVSFEENLTNVNDITIYARSSDENSTASIEIYRENGNESISVIENISSEGYYKTYLTNLSGGESVGVYDLKIIGRVEFDYIVDPYSLNLTTNGTGNNVTVEPNYVAHLNITDSSLVLYMPFDVQEDSGNKTYDYSNNSNDGTATNGVLFNSSGGVYGGDYQFDGVNDYVNVLDANILDPEEGNFTICGWFNPNNIQANKRIASKRGTNHVNTTATSWYEIYQNVGSLYFSISDNYQLHGQALASLALSSNNTWYHFCGVWNWDQKNATLYLNGGSSQNSYVETKINTSINSTAALTIGTYSSANFNGSIDEFMIFNRALSPTETAQIYSSTYSRFYSTGEVLFQNLNLGTKDKVNLTLNSCSQINGSYLQGKINDGNYQNFSGCSLSDYLLSGDKTSANLTVKFLSTPYNFYSPLVIGNVSVAEFRNDTTAPSVVINSPSNNSYISSTVIFNADINDNYGTTYAFINDSSLVGYWTFDTTNSTGVYDTSGKNNFGTFNGGLSTSNLSLAKFGDGLSFDGNVASIVVSDSDSLDMKTGDFSFSYWIKLNNRASPASQAFARHGGGYATSNPGWTLFYSNGNPYLQFSSSSAVYNNALVPSATQLSNSIWYHVVGVFDRDGNFTHYLNGVKNGNGIDISAGNGVSITPSQSLTFASVGSGLYLLNGSIDEVLIFNRTLSADEIKALYNSSAQKFNVSYTLPLSGVNTVNLLAVDTASNANLTTLLLNNDATFPTISFENPTPSNGSYVSSTTQTIVANISDNSAGNTSSFIDFDRSLVGYWAMDYYNTTGVYDNSSWGDFGTFAGTGFSSSNISQGARGNGITFDGVNDYLSFSNYYMKINVNSDYSISFWINIKNSSSRQLAIGTSNGSLNRIGITVASGNIYFEGYNGSYGGIRYNALAQNQWVYVAAVKNSGSYYLYINKDSKNNGGAVGYLGGIGNKFVMGSDNLWYMNGSLDEVMIFNRSLSQTEINALYNSQANKFNATFSSLSSGQHNYTLYGVDTAGNVNTSIRNFIVDTQAPQVEFISPTLDNGIIIKDNFFYINTTITDNTNSDRSAWIDWNKSLVGYWAMDYYNTTGVYDNSSYGNFGSFYNGIGISNLTAGARGQGLEFDAVNDYVRISFGIPNIDNTTTYSWWNYYKKTDALFPTIMGDNAQGNCALGGNYSWIYYAGGYNSTRISLGGCNGTTARAISFVNMTSCVNQWCHYVLVVNFTSAKASIYQNGAIISTLDDTFYSPNGWKFCDANRLKYFGSYSGGATAYLLNGSLDEVMIFSRSLSSVEIQSLYNNSAYRYQNNFTSLSDGTYNYSVYAIDSAGNLNITSMRNVTLDLYAPTYSQNQTNNSEAGQSTLFSLYVDDNLALNDNGQYIFSTNNTGIWTNDTAVNFTSTPEWANVTKVLNSTGNLAIGYTWYMTDNLSNMNNTEIYIITANDTTEPLVSIALPVSGQIFSTSSVTFQVTTNENSTCNYSINSWVTNVSMTPDSNGTIHTATATLSNANYVALYLCTDLYGNINSTKNVSFSVSVSSGSPAVSEDTGGGGGGGGAAATTTNLQFTVSPDSIERTLAINKIELGQIEVNNEENSSRVFNVGVEVLNSIISFEKSSIEIGPKDSGKFEFRLTPPAEAGMYTGKIIISSGYKSKEIPVIINVRTEKSLYDIIITISKSMRVIEPSTNLIAQIDLLQMGLKEKMDVTLNYIIKDYNGKVYLSESETIAVENQKVLEKEFHTSEFPEGDYVLGVELIYPDGVAVASSQFRVGSENFLSEDNHLVYIIAAVIIVVLAGTFIIIRRYRRMVKLMRKGKK